MRIKKPKGQQVEYKIYSNIEERNTASDKFINGQEVKILDASADPEIEDGWAIYKYDKTNNIFDLLEKEHEDLYKPEYYEFATYQKMAEKRNTLSSGATVRVLDASYDPQVKKGQAYYLVDASDPNYTGLKLICKEESLGADGISIFEDSNQTLHAPSAFISHSVNTRILEDFDYTMKFVVDHFVLEPIGGIRTVPIRFQENEPVKFMTLQSYDLYYDRMTNGGKGKRVNWTIQPYIRETNVIVGTKLIGTNGNSGEIVPIHPNDNETSMIIMQVSAKIPSNNSEPKETDFTIHKYWKKALAPFKAPEPVEHDHSYTQPDGQTIKFVDGKLVAQFPTPEEQTAVSIDEFTIEKNDDVLTVPAALNPIIHNYTIREDFELHLNFDDRNFIKVTPLGADTNGFLEIPMQLETGGQFYKIQLGTVNLPVSAFTGSPEFIHFGIMAKKQQTKAACHYIVEPDGSAIKFRPMPTDTSICIAQIRVKKPLGTDGWRVESVAMWKYWKTSLLSVSGGETVEPDGYGAEYTEINGIKQITSIGGMTPTYYNERYHEDFDFDFKVLYNSELNTLNIVAKTIGAERVIKGTRALADENGVVGSPSIFYASIRNIDSQFNNPTKGKYIYFHFGCKNATVQTLQSPYSYHLDFPRLEPENAGISTFGLIKVFIPKDGEMFEYSKVHIYKFWKNALSTTEERIKLDWYGVSRNFASSSPTCERIGNLDMHKNLPIQSQMKRCLLWDNGTVHYYLDPNNSTKKADGTAAVLDGSHGQVMVEIPEYYYSYERVGTICNYKISLVPLEGFKRIKKTYVSAYESAMQRSTSKLCSLVNLDPDFRGGVNNSSDDANVTKTGLGRPLGNELRSTLRTAAFNRGDNWHMYHVYTHYMLSMLFVIEHNTFNTQLAFNAELNAFGFKQGGLGKGATDGDSIGHMVNRMSAIIPCGATNSLGNNTGESNFTAIGFAMGSDQQLTVSSYRGIENLFGHMSKLVDGINSIASHAYVSEIKKGMSDDIIDGFEYVGRLGTGNYQTDVYDHILPLPKSTLGGSSTTYLCDTSTVNANNSAVAMGGMLSGLEGGGLFHFHAAISTTPITYAGTRLCFTKE